MKTLETLDPPRGTLILGLLFGLGIAIHPIFFLFAFVFALALLPAWFHPVVRGHAH